MAFRTQSLKFESLGAILREKRILSDWSLEDVEKKIGVPAKYLKLLEEDEFYKLPSPTYTRGFLLQYAELLGFNPEEVVNLWKKESSYSIIKETKNKRVRKLPLVEFGKEKFFDIFNSRFFFIGLVALGVLLYLFFGVKKLIFPPEIQLLSPRTNLVTKETSLIIEGKVDDGVEVFINKQKIDDMTDDYFKVKLELERGINNIEISAKKKYSRERIIKRQIIVE